MAGLIMEGRQFVIFPIILSCLTLLLLLKGVECNQRPVCNQTFYSTKFNEGPGDGYVVFTVNCQDTDPGLEGELTYTLSDGAKGQFRVDSQTGSVIVQGNTDAERLFGDSGQLANPYTISIIVADKGNPPYSTPVTVLVDLVSINDNTPTMIDLPPSVKISETEAVGKVVSTCQLVDDDVDNSNHGIAYVRIKGGNELGKFVLNQLNCDLMLISPLDYETTPSFTLTLEAYDLDPVNPRSSTKDLLIEVEDVNDFTPACVGYNILREVSESAPVATTLTTLDCFDNDGGLNGQLEFKTIKGDRKLTVDKITGDVSLVEPLDFEAGDDLLEMEVIVYDLGTPSLSASVTVLFKVKDADDNPPQWTQDVFNASISEVTLLGSIVISLSATDLDTPNSDLSKITYGLEDVCYPDWFLVDAQIGSVVVKNPVDWETSNLVTCKVHAYSSDKFENRTIANISISLTDVNDRAPIFDKFLFTGSIKEDAPLGTTILRVEAMDPDDGINGKFSLSMPQDSPFTIDPNTGEVTLIKTIDFETNTNYLLTVLAKDKGIPTQSSLTYINIQVEPVNEFAPTISPGISLSISEDAEPGTALTKMSADDRDAGLDGEVEFFLLDSDVPFLLESATGDLRIGIGLDRETKAAYSLDIMVMDKSNTSVRSSQSTIRVTITDVNDNAPVCELISDVQVFPPISKVNPVAKLSCTDPDVGNTLSYDLIGGDIYNMFDVNSRNGEITLVGTPMVGLFTLYIDVLDNGTPILKVTVPVPITVESQFKFENLPTSLLVWENTTVFSYIYTVNTSGTWDFVSSEIVAGNDDKMFNLNPSSGDIRLINLLDWETKKSHVLTIRSISSNGQLIESDLTIDIIDINDDDPTFDDTFFHIKVVENLPVPTLLKIITANDYDEGISSEIDYSVFSGNDEGIFNFTETGEFLLLKNLDYEKWTSYSITIQAFDRGDPSLSSTAVVFVEVVNQDDHPLLVNFVESSRRFNMSEDISVGTLVVMMNGSDADTNSDIEYSIASGNELGYFTIHKENGTVYTATSLDYETAHSVSLGVEAMNSMDVSKILTLDVDLLDINDNTPTFSKQFYSVQIPHATKADKAVGPFVVTDADSEDNGRFTLTIETGNDKNHFRLSGSDLVTNVEIDSDVQDFYSLVIQAIDHGVPQRSSSTIYQIIVDEKLLTPKFSSGQTSLSIQEDRVPGTIYDCDATMAGSTEGEQGDITYTISNGNVQNYFFIDSFTCKIDLVKTLDFSSIPEYTLEILATHKENSRLNDSFVVNVRVIQMNKHTPVFTQEIYTWIIPENISIGASVGSVSAFDKDVGDFGAVEYVIENNSKFGINSSSGLIDTVDSFDYRVAQSYHLYITAKDGGTSVIRSSSAVVIVDIVDINNHIPAFLGPNMEIDVPESSSAPVDIIAITAKDDDTEEGGEIRYSISSGDTTTFSIHSTLGVLTLLTPLDYETQTEYVLEITAQDQGNPSLSSTTTLTVSVTDFNDNSPVFPFDRIDVPVFLDAVPFTIVININATDLDAGLQDSTINYFILEGNTNGLFTIDTDTGELKTVRYILDEDISYDLVVIAKDHGIPSLTGTATVGVRILPGSSNSTDYYFSVEESKPRGTLVGQITKDPNWDVIEYVISSGNYNNNFMISTTKNGDGVIYTARSLDREAYPLYQLGVTLKLSAGEEHLIVSVAVNDINDNKPIAQETDISIDLVENTPKGTTLAQIVVTDADADENGDLVFSISSLTPLGQKHFSVSDVGAILVKTEIDYEVFKDLVFIVEIKDQGRQPRSTSVTVSVIVLDVEEEEVLATTGEAPSTFVSLEIPHTLKKGDKVFVADIKDFNITMDDSHTVEFMAVGENVFALDSGSGQVTIELESLLFPTSSYLQWIVCKAVNATASETKLAMVRIDTFDANEHMIALIVSLDVGDLELQRENLIDRLQTYFSPENVVKIWAVKSTSSITAKRRRLLTTESVALVVVIADDSTDDVGNLDSNKIFLTQAQLLAALQADPSGTPVAGLSDVTIPVTYVVPYVNDEADSSDAHPAHVTFYFIIALAAIIALVLIVALTTYFVIQYRKSKGSLNLSKDSSDEEHLCPSPDEGNEEMDDKLQDPQEKALILMSNPVPNARQLPPLETGFGNHPFHSYRPPSRALKTPQGFLRPVLVPPLDTAKAPTKKEEDGWVVTKKSKRLKPSLKKPKEKPKPKTKRTSETTKPNLTLIDDPYRIAEDEDDFVDNTDGRKQMMKSLEDEQIAKTKQLLMEQEAQKRRRVASMRAGRKLSENVNRNLQPPSAFWPKRIKNAWRSPKSSSVENPDLSQLEVAMKGPKVQKKTKWNSPYEEKFARPYRDKLIQQHDSDKGIDSKEEIDRRKSFAGFVLSAEDEEQN